MLFNSLEYAIFLPTVLALFWALRHRAQNTLLLVASYAFYGAWDWRFLGLLIFTTAVDYTVGRLLGSLEDERKRRTVLALSIVANLSVLAFFKYADFFVASAAGLLETVGLEANPSALRILLPVGVSFYTFQSMSYTIDVYRRRMEPVLSLADFALFVAYFPQLVAGPIERATRLVPQLSAPRARPSFQQVRSACTLILIGLFKKVAIADAVAPAVDSAFEGASEGSWLGLLVAVYAFALQIYGDFSGYTDIARGSSRLFGVELMHNFEQPYLSRNVTEFWRTWHISLSTWLRDYLYVPLGGNRSGGAATYRNLMLVMLLGGLWHGAAWTFVAWGALHGAALGIHRAVSGAHVSRTAAIRPRLRDVPAVVVTFHFVCFAWIFFRADGFTQALDVITGIVTLRAGPVDAASVALVALALVATLALDWFQRTAGRHEFVMHWRAGARGVAYAAMFLFVVAWTGGQSQPFIYFQF